MTIVDIIAKEVVLLFIRKWPDDLLKERGQMKSAWTPEFKIIIKDLLDRGIIAPGDAIKETAAIDGKDVRDYLESLDGGIGL